MADEGFWVHDARNLVLTGSYGDDEWHNRFVSPLIHWPLVLMLTHLGNDLLTVRIWAMCLSLMSLLFFWRISRKLDPSGLLFLLFAVNSLLVAYQRIAILESAVIPVSLATMWLWIKARHRRIQTSFQWMDLLVGVCAALVWLVKSTQIYFIPTVLGATLLAELNGRRGLKTATFQLLGISSVVIPWLIFVRIPNAGLLTQYDSYYLSQQGSTAMDLLRNTVMNPMGVYFSALPVLFTAAIAFTVQLAVKRNFKLIPPGVTFAWMWLVCGALFFSPFGYRPLRYYLPLTIPILILGWRALSARKPDRCSNYGRWLAIALCSGFVLSMMPFVLDGLITDGSLLGIPPVPGFPVLLPIASLVCLIPVILVTLFSSDTRRKRLANTLILCSLVLHIGLVSTRLVNRRYEITETSQSLNKILPADSVLAGQWAPELVLNTDFRAVPVWKGFVNGDDPFQKHGITHLIAWEYVLGNELTCHQTWFPDVFSSAKKIAEYEIKESRLSLWEIAASEN